MVAAFTLESLDIVGLGCAEHKLIASGSQDPGEGSCERNVSLSSNVEPQFQRLIPYYRVESALVSPGDLVKCLFYGAERYR